MITFINLDMFDIKKLQNIARELRVRTIENSHKTGTPHLGSCLSCLDILVVIYFVILRINPKLPKSLERDRFILSKGHAAPALFQVLAMKGFFPDKLFETYGQNGSLLGEHPPSPEYLSGIEAATGSLGHGLSIGLGIALSARIQHQEYKVYVLLGDGECNEGSVWEAAMMAASQKVDNLVVLIDFNKWQATNRSEEVFALSPLVEKWQAFGWDSYEIDGHDINQLIEVLSKKNNSGKPIAFIANTIKGKGVSFMEDDNNWHYRIPNEEELNAARKELEIIE